MSMKRMLGVLAFALLPLSGCADHPYEGELRAAMDAPYQLASGDRLRVIVFGQDNLTNSFSVDGAGNIAMPLIGLVHAQGATTAQLAGEIELGEVNTSGQYPYINGMTAQTAVAVAGGFSPRGYQYGVDVTRTINGVPTTASVPMTFPIRPGDTVTVRERFF
jgi:polysaccharide export outer membrane protein